MKYALRRYTHRNPRGVQHPVIVYTRARDCALREGMYSELLAIAADLPASRCLTDDVACGPPVPTYIASLAEVRLVVRSQYVSPRALRT